MDDRATLIPKVCALYQNYPNPFNPNTTFEFVLPKSMFVTLTIFSLRGEQAAGLLAEQQAGVHHITWDASGLGNGVYLYWLEAGDFAHSKKLALMR